MVWFVTIGRHRLSVPVLVLHKIPCSLAECSVPGTGPGGIWDPGTRYLLPGCLDAFQALENVNYLYI